MDGHCHRTCRSKAPTFLSCSCFLLPHPLELVGPDNISKNRKKEQLREDNMLRDGEQVTHLMTPANSEFCQLLGGFLALLELKNAVALSLVLLKLSQASFLSWRASNFLAIFFLLKAHNTLEQFIASPPLVAWKNCPAVLTFCRAFCLSCMFGAVLAATRPLVWAATMQRTKAQSLLTAGLEQPASISSSAEGLLSSLTSKRSSPNGSASGLMLPLCFPQSHGGRGCF